MSDSSVSVVFLEQPGNNIRTGSIAKKMITACNFLCIFPSLTKLIESSKIFDLLIFNYNIISRKCKLFIEVDWVQRFKGSEVQRFKGSEVQGFRGSEAQGFRGSEVQGFSGSGVQRSVLSTLAGLKSLPASGGRPVKSRKKKIA